MKNSIDQLAILGGASSFSESLHVGKPNTGDRKQFFRRMDELFERGWLTNNGPLVQEFEVKLAAFLDVSHCIVMCNATIALEILIRALDLHGEVIVPSFTFIATAHSLQWQEISPVFCDIDPATHNIDPRQVERIITPRTTGIIGVHVWGRACDIEGLEAVSQSHGLKLIFDAAHAFGCTHKGKMIGNFGRAEVFSFHATKFFNTFEGGAITTNDEELAAKIRLMKNFGFAGYDEVCYIGTNGKMSEANAAMGITNLESLDEFIEINHRNYATYIEELKGLPGIQCIQYDEKERNNYQYIVVEIDESVAGLSRDTLVKVLHAENVLARRYFYPGCHQMEPYLTLFPQAGLLLENTNRLTQCVMSLPNGTAISEDEIKEICQIIRLCAENWGALKARISFKK